MQLTMLEGLIEKLGIPYDHDQSWGIQGCGYAVPRDDKEERAYFNSIVESIHAQFIKDVAAGRKMDAGKDTESGRRQGFYRHTGQGSGAC